MARPVFAAVVLTIVVAGCVQQVTLRPTPSAGASATPAASAIPSGGWADTIFRDANVITMDEATPRAQAVAVTGDRIVAFGTNDELAALAGPDTAVVTLRGLTLAPGFIDAHQHRIGDGLGKLGKEPGELIDEAIAQGWTMIDELYVDQGRLDALRDLDQAGILRVRVNAYLTVQENSAEGRLLGDYYDAYRPGQRISPHVRVAGLKVFTDFDNAKILLWKQASLNDFLVARHQEGWPLAIKTVSTRSLAMILQAMDFVRAADPTVVDSRTRLEHMLFATPEQIAREKELGLVPMINFNNPGQLVGLSDVDELIASEPTGAYAPWRSVFEAGLAAAGMSGFPSGYVDEPSGAPFGSPIHLIYQGVTRVGTLGVRSPASLMDQAISAEQAMKAHTINAARATFQETEIGSISAGKLADLVVLSADPLAVDAEAINDIDVLMTMIGGRVEWCAPGSEAACPTPGSVNGPNPTPGTSSGAGGPGGAIVATASASLPDGPPGAAVDGDLDTAWNAGKGPGQWIQLDSTLGNRRRWPGSAFVVAQYPAGPTVHQIWVGPSDNELRIVHEFDGETVDGQELVWTPDAPEPDVRVVRVVTTVSPSWVAWREIEVSGS